MVQRRVVLGLGHGGDLPVLSGPGFAVDGVVDLGPFHPSLPGSLRLALDVERDVVVTAEPLIGAMHRGAEKLFEVRDYRQAMVLANRHDWLSAFASELCLALVIERMCGIAPPPRANWLRMVFAEVTRVISHLAFVSSYPGLDPVLAARGHQAKEAGQRILELGTGARVHTMAVRVGGLLSDVPEGWVDEVVDQLPRWTTVADELTAGLADIADRSTGIAVLTRDQAVSFAATGPVGRASGLDLDLRRDEPYLHYADIVDELAVITDFAGDAAARIRCRAAEITSSVRLIAACIDRLSRLESTEVNVLLPKVLRVPEGHGYAWTENPLGVAGYYLVSTGEKVPWRLKMRTASFNNAAALSAALPGTSISDLSLALASWGIIVGDLDR